MLSLSHMIRFKWNGSLGLVISVVTGSKMMKTWDWLNDKAAFVGSGYLFLLACFLTLVGIKFVGVCGTRTTYKERRHAKIIYGCN